MFLCLSRILSVVLYWTAEGMNEHIHLQSFKIWSIHTLYKGILQVQILVSKMIAGGWDYVTSDLFNWRPCLWFFLWIGPFLRHNMSALCEQCWLNYVSIANLFPNNTIYLEDQTRTARLTTTTTTRCIL